MKNLRIIEGKWWIHGDSKPCYYGQLTFDPEEGLTLEVKIPVNRSIEEVAWVAKGSEVSSVIHGIDAHEKYVTLFGCGSLNHNSSLGFESYRIRALQALLGERLNNWDEAKYLTARIHYTLLCEWVNEEVYESTVSKDGRSVIALKNLDDSRIYELPDGVKFRLERDFSTHNSLEKIEWHFNQCIYFHFEQEQSVENILSRYVHSFRQLLSLLVGKRIYVEDVTLLHYDPFKKCGVNYSSAELLQSCRGISTAEKEVYFFNMFAPFSEIYSKFDAILKSWFETSQRMKPVIDLYFSGIFFSLPLTTRFLNLAQAMEAYHSRCGDFKSVEIPTIDHRKRVEEVVSLLPATHQEWVRQSLAYANRKTLAQRFNDLFDLFKNETASLFEGIPDISEGIRHTRNYLTHYTDTTKSKAFTDDDLLPVTFKLEGFLIICLLRKLGIIGEPINRVMKRYTQARFRVLKSVSEPKNDSQVR